MVTLTTTADTGSTFTGWSGACTNTSGDCVVTMDGAKSVTATFTLEQYAQTLATAGTGSGSKSADPDQILYDYGTVITLTGTANSGSYFDGWSGDLSGTTTPLAYTITADTAVTITFTLEQYELSVSLAGTGSGSVASDPVGISCDTAGGDCTETFDYGTVVTLTATAEAGSVFTGWSEACSGTGDCVGTIDEARNVTATFTLEQADYFIFLPILAKP